MAPYDIYDITGKKNMEDQFRDILDIEDVLGIMVLSLDGNIVYNQFKLNMPEGFSGRGLNSFIHALNNAKEAELHYENRLIYILKSRKEFVLVMMQRSAPIALVRLSCRVIVHKLDKINNKNRGLGRFFSKRVDDN